MRTRSEVLPRLSSGTPLSPTDTPDWTMKLTWAVAANALCSHPVATAYTVSAGPPTPAVAVMNPDASPVATFVVGPASNLIREVNATRAIPSRMRPPMSTCSRSFGSARDTSTPGTTPTRPARTSVHTRPRSTLRQVEASVVAATTTANTFARTTPWYGPTRSTSSGVAINAKPMPLTRCTPAPTRTASAWAMIVTVMAHPQVSIAVVPRRGAEPNTPTRRPPPHSMSLAGPRAPSEGRLRSTLHCLPRRQRRGDLLQRGAFGVDAECHLDEAGEDHQHGADHEREDRVAHVAGADQLREEQRSGDSACRGADGVEERDRQRPGLQREDLAHRQVGRAGAGCRRALPQARQGSRRCQGR